MNVKLIVFSVLISISLWGISLYNGWLNEAFIFGYNIFTGWFDEKTPSISTNKDITTVRYGKFAYKLLTNINIPDNITTIEKNAFKGNKLTSVTIGSNILLGKNAFGFGFEDVYKDNGMSAGTYTRTDIRSNKWSIWYDHFRYLNHNGNITITGYNGTGGTVVVPSEINGNQVTNIEENAFRKKELTSITISNSVNTIGVNAFAENQITRISIGANVKLGDVGSDGILGANTGFNTAYNNNNGRAGIYTRPNTSDTRWTRSLR